jgi:TolB protein
MPASTRPLSHRWVTRIGLLLVIALAFAPVSPSPGASAAVPRAEGSPVPTPHPFADEPAWIAYQTYRTGADGVDADGIGLMYPDGTDDHPIAADVRDAQLLPDWSPGGTRLVFTMRGGETEPLYEYDLATDNSHQIFSYEDPCLSDDDPAYAPDGKRVAFIRALAPFVSSEALGTEVPSDCGLWIGELNSGEVTQITSNTDPPYDREYIPHWSPDSAQLTYWRDPYENGQPTGTAVYVINADGTNERRLTDPAMFAGFSDWSPDGEWIVFDTYPLLEFQCCQVSNLYRIHPDGSGMEQLTLYTTEDLRAAHPRYTPDGKWIVFTVVTPTSRSLWVIPAAGGEPIVITPPGAYTHGAWQPTPAAS